MKKKMQTSEIFFKNLGRKKSRSKIFVKKKKKNRSKTLVENLDQGFGPIKNFCRKILSKIFVEKSRSKISVENFSQKYSSKISIKKFCRNFLSKIFVKNLDQKFLSKISLKKYSSKISVENLGRKYSSKIVAKTFRWNCWLKYRLRISVEDSEGLNSVRTEVRCQTDRMGGIFSQNCASEKWTTSECAVPIWRFGILPPGKTAVWTHAFVVEVRSLQCRCVDSSSRSTASSLGAPGHFAKLHPCFKAMRKR